MTALDHMTLRVRDLSKSIGFYMNIVGLIYICRVGLFELIKVNPRLTIALLQEDPKDQVHLAFSFDSASFHALHARLVSQKVPFGGEVSVRDGRISENAFGARGMAKALYFYDPNMRNLEARLYVAET
ncbi:MAG: VOC family protein [Gallionella sp.]